MTVVSLFDRPLPNDIAQVWQILHAGEKLIELTSHVSLGDYRADEVLQLACERLLITIGEAASRTSENFRLRNQQVPWNDMIALGERLLYGEHVESTETWMIARGRVGGWVRAIEPLIS